MAIPSVDVADFLYGDSNTKSAFVKALGNAYEEIGFVGVKNHGVSYELIIELYKQVQQFFSLPLQQKKSYEDPLLAGQRGYTSFGKEHAKGFEVPDLKEFYQYGQVPLTEEQAKVYKNPNNDPRGRWRSIPLTAQEGHATPDQFFEIVNCTV